MPRAATAFVEFEGDFSQIGRNAGSQAKSLEGSFNSSFKRIAAFAAGALASIGVGKVLKDAFKEAEDAQKVGRQTAAVIKSTGGLARVSAKQVDSLANSLSAVAGVDDEVIASGENVLLTFTNVRNQVGAGNDIFNQATTAAVNLSAALGTDLQGSVIQIGKALNDPIKGVTALQRVGVSFTKQQKDQIKTLVESGKTLEAQKLILHELGTEFGGAAAAAATPSQKLGVAFKNIEESIGLLFLPLLDRLASFLTKTVAPAIERSIPIVEAFAQVIATAFAIGFGGKSISGIHGWLKVFALVGAALKGFIDFVKGDVASAGVQLGKVFGLSEDDSRVAGFIDALGSIRNAISQVVQFIIRNWKPVLAGVVIGLGLLFAPITTVVAGLLFLYLRFKLVRDVVATVVESVKTATKAVRSVDWGGIFKRVAADISKAIGVIRSVIDAVVGFFTSHSKDFEAIGAGFVKVWQQFAPTVKAAFDAVVAIVRVALGIVIGIITVAVNIATDLWDRFGRQILDKLRIAFNAIVDIVRGALQIVRGIMEVITGILTLKWAKAWQGIKDVFAGAWNLIVGLAKFFINQLSTAFGAGMALISEAFHLQWTLIKTIVSGAVDAVVGFVKSLPGRLLALVGLIAAAGLAVGAAILNGIKDGIAGAVGFVTDVGKAIANATIGFVNTIIDSINGALEFRISLPFGKHFSIDPPDIPHIPKLHGGGIFAAQSGDEGLALLKNGEGVFTPEQLKAIGRDGGLPSIDARFINNGTIFGVEDLEAKFEAHTDEVVAEIAAVIKAGTRP